MDDVDFFFALGELKRIQRSGWKSIGIKLCESIADHSFRTALIAYYLAKKEGLSEEKAREAVILALLHDIHESRISDLTRMNKNYLSVDYKKAREDSLSETFKIFENIRDEKIINIVKDADLLEMFFQAKEYYDEGNNYAKEWLKKDKLKSKSAKYLFEKMVKRNSRAWLLEGVKW